MGSAKKRRRVVRLSAFERVVLVIVVGLGVYVGWDIYLRYWGGPAVGGLASRVYAPNGEAPARGAGKRPATSARAVPARPQPPPEDPTARQPTTYTPPSGLPASPGAKGAGAAPAAGPAAAPAPPDEVRFPTWSDADPSLMSPGPKR